MIELNKIHCMDCLEGMKLMEDDSVDLVVTSPPYNLGFSFRGKKKVNMYENYKDNLQINDYYDFIKNVIIQLIRVTKRNVFFNFQLLSKNKEAYLQILADFKYNIKDIIIWHKKQWEPSIQPHCLSSAFEFIIIFGKKKDCEKRSFESANFNNRISGQQTSNVIFGNSASVKELNSNQGTNHAVFPQYLVRYLLDKFTKIDDIIFDPFSGSGTTCLVAKQKGLKYVGFEIDSKLIEVSNKRLEQNNLNNWC